MRKLLALVALAGCAFVMSCSDDEPTVVETFDAPTGSLSFAGNIEFGGSGTVTGTITIDADLTATWSSSAEEGVTLTTASGELVGGDNAVELAVTANSGYSGIAVVEIAVTDSEGQTQNFTATGSVEPDGDTVPTIEGVPATLTVTEGETVEIGTVTIRAEDGLAGMTLTINDGAALPVFNTFFPEATVGATEASNDITVSPETLTTIGITTAGTYTLDFEVSDTDGDIATAQHVLIIEAFETPVVNVRGDIEGTVDWTADNIYQLDTRVTVLDGATLNIAAGTIIKGNEGQGSAATALLVARGGTLNAIGTAELPIIFTSVFDPITPADVAAGNYASTTSATQAGLWGGVIVLGKANITGKVEDGDGNTTEDLAELQIEGIPSSDENGLYGGTEDDDNSGTISYISIRHGGTNIGAGNEINGLTLGGVGTGTMISNVEVVANADDGIEFFGGSVSVDGAVIWNSFDDSMDTDQDYNGSVTNFIIVTPNTGSAFELDGPEGSRTRGVDHIFSEGVIYGGADIDAIVDWDDDTNASLNNLYFFGISAGRVDSFGGIGTNDNSNTANWETDLADNAGGWFTGAENVITYGVAVGSKSYGPSAADFAWTWASNSGALSDLGL